MRDTFSIVGNAEQLRYLYDSIYSSGGSCVNIVAEGWPGRNFVKDLSRRTKATLRMAGTYHINVRSTRSVKLKDFKHCDKVLVAGSNEQERTFNAMSVWKCGVSKEQIYMIPNSLFGTGTAVLTRHGGVNEFILPMNGVKPSLRYMEYHITDFCNLKCKGCGHCSNIVKELTFSDLGEFESGLKRLSELFSNIRVLRLMGGEPLLCDYLDKFIDVAHGIFPYSEIKIVSNGILYKRISEKLIQSMQRSNVVLQITQYPPTVKIAKGILSFCQANNIHVEMSSPVENFYYTKKSDNDINYISIWKKCSSKNCHFMHGTRFYPCTAVWVKHAFSKELGNGGIDDSDHRKYSFDLTEPLMKNGMDGWDILKMIESPFRICDKCGDKQIMFRWESEAGKALNYENT